MIARIEEEMKTHTKHCRVHEGEPVDLKKRPTAVDPVDAALLGAAMYGLAAHDAVSCRATE